MGLANRLLRALATPPDDQPIGPSRDVEDQVHGGLLVGSKLDEFRLLVGIHSAPSMQGMRTKQNRLSLATTILSEKGTATATSQQLSDRGTSVDDHGRQSASILHLQRPAENRGIYGIVCNHGLKAKKNYKTFSLMINVCLGLQLIVAAALTALGAANGSRSAVTVFGAINTVIAGLMTYLKGSGLPGRLKYFQHEWEKIRDYIEARERDLRINDQAFDVYAEVQFIRQLYQDVMQDIEQNRPDRFVSSGKLHTLQSEGFGGRQQQQEQAGVNPRPSLARGTSFGAPAAMNFGATTGPANLQGMLKKFEDLHESLEQKKEAGHDVSHEVLEQARDAAKALQEKIHGFARHTQAEMRDIKRDAEHEFTGLERRLGDAVGQASFQGDRASTTMGEQWRSGQGRTRSLTEEQAAALTRVMGDAVGKSTLQVQNVQSDIGHTGTHTRRRFADAERSVTVDAEALEARLQAARKDIVGSEAGGRSEGEDNTPGRRTT